MDRKTRKLLTIYGGLHPRSCIDRLYMPKSDAGRGLAKYATQSKEALAKTAAFQTQLEKVYCHCEQGRKERKSIERVEGKIAT